MGERMKSIRKIACRVEQANQYRQHDLKSRVEEALLSWYGMELSQIAEIVRIRSRDYTIKDKEVAKYIPADYRVAQDDNSYTDSSVMHDAAEEFGISMEQLVSYIRKLTNLKRRGVVHVTRSKSYYLTHYYIGGGRTDGETCKTYAKALISADALERKYTPSPMYVFNRPSTDEYIEAADVAERLCEIIGHKIERIMGVGTDVYENLRMQTGKRL